MCTRLLFEETVKCICDAKWNKQNIFYCQKQDFSGASDTVRACAEYLSMLFFPWYKSNLNLLSSFK